MAHKSLITESTAMASPTVKITLIGFTYLCLNLFLSVAGQMLLKFGMDKTGPFDFTISLSSYLMNMLNFPVVIGTGIYLIGTLFWLLTLCKMDLSYAYPASSLQYPIVFAGAWYFFGETITWLRIGGLICICLGVVVMSLEKEPS
jgi:multidrug transporter EmrE-like cation transporter